MGKLIIRFFRLKARVFAKLAQLAEDSATWVEVRDWDIRRGLDVGADPTDEV